MTIFGSLLLVLIMVGCTARLGGGDADEVGGTIRTDGDGDGDGDGGDGDGDGCIIDQVSAAPLRRLSKVEFENTIGDLFPGVDTSSVSVLRDNPVEGFENNADSLNPSPLLIEQYHAVAVDIAARAADISYEELVPCDPATDSPECGRLVIESLGRRVFRRPLDQSEIAAFEEFFLTQAAEVSFEAAVELLISAMLQSPEFIYRLEFGGEADAQGVSLTDYELATRLSYLVWQSTPDESLLTAAAEGQLSTLDGLESEAVRMLEAPRAAEAMADFHRQWFEFDKLLDQEKDPELFPDWSNDLRASLYEEARRFTKEVFESGAGTLGELFTSRTTWVDEHLAAFYGVAAPGSGWQKVELPDTERAGILTTGAFLASHARPTNGSPPLRGVSVLDQILCNSPPPPPPTANTSIDPGEFAEPVTNRQMFESRTSQDGCIGCHTSIDGIGFAFEHYDSTGQHRDQDNGFPVDASGELVGTDVDGPVEGAVELSERLAQSHQVEVCVASKWFRYAHGRDETESDSCKVGDLADKLADSGGDVRTMLLHLVRSAEFRYRPPSN